MDGGRGRGVTGGRGREWWVGRVGKGGAGGVGEGFVVMVGMRVCGGVRKLYGLCVCRLVILFW